MRRENFRVVKTKKNEPVKEEAPQRTDGVEKINEEFLSDNPYRVEGIEKNVSGAVYSPLIFVNNTMLRCSSPYDICIRQIDDVMNRYKYNMENGMADVYREVRSLDNSYDYDLRRNIIELVDYTYDEAIEAAVEGYLEQTLVQKFTLVDPDTNETFCPIREFITAIPRSGRGLMVDWEVNAFWNICDEKIPPIDKSKALEEQIQVIVHGITRGIANALCGLARQISFGEPYYFGHETTGVVDSYIRDIYMAEAAAEVNVDITPQDFYGIQMSEYMCILDGMVPIIEVLVRQCCEVIKYFYSRYEEIVSDN